MKITLINHSDTQGGSSVVAFRLMEAMRRLGVDARMLVGRKNSDSPYVEQAASPWKVRLPFYKEHLRIFTHNGFSKEQLFQVSIASDGLPLSRHPLVRQADAVILNWVNQGILSFSEIERIAKLKPTFWIMHDQWNFTSICHHTGACDKYLSHCSRCKFLGWMAGNKDLSYKVFDRKGRLYANTDITFIGVSQWLASRAGKSALLADKKVAYISNAFPIDEFAAEPAFSRADLGLPLDKKLIVFCAARIDDPAKGLPDAIELLNGLDESHREAACAVFVGACRNPRALDCLKMRHLCLGPTEDQRVIRSVMHHADVVLSTSPFETLGATLIEAQAAGSTPVCYTHDGRGEIVTDGVSGYSLGSDRDESIKTLRRALDNPIPREALLKSAERYSAESIARRYIDLVSRSV